MNLMDFHKIGKGGQPYDIIDDKIAQYIIDNQNIMVISGKAYLYKNGVYRMDENGTILKYLVKSCIVQELVTYSRVERVCKLIISEHKLQVKPDEVNLYPDTVINFQNGMLDILTGELYDHDPKYRSVNQIPHDYIPGLDIKDSIFHRFIQSRIPHEDDQRMLFEFMGYCLLNGIVFQKFLILCGLGDSGKSTIINFISRIIGEDNISALSLQELSSRFSTAYLLHKQLNTCGDIPSSALKDTAVIKQLLGEDSVKAEIKGGAVFFFRNTAKFLFSCNELPLVLDEKSNGFYRRLLVINFENAGTYIPNLKRLLSEEKEIQIVISHVVGGAKNAIQRGRIYESGASSGAVLQLQKDSDTVTAFLEDWTEPRPNHKIRRPDFYNYYEEFCREENRQPLGKTGFFRSLRVKGIKESKVQGIRYFCDLDVPFRKTSATFNVI